MIKFVEERSMPISISTSKGRQYLWMVLGSSTPLSSNQHHGVRRVKLIEVGDESYSLVSEEKVHGEKLLEHLQGGIIITIIIMDTI